MEIFKATKLCGICSLTLQRALLHCRLKKVPQRYHRQMKINPVNEYWYLLIIRNRFTEFVLQITLKQ